jgi:hypothetical protein
MAGSETEGCWVLVWKLYRNLSVKDNLVIKKGKILHQ